MGDAISVSPPPPPTPCAQPAPFQPSLCIAHPLHSSHAEKIFFLVSFRLARRARERDKSSKKEREIYISEARVEILFATYACPVLLCGFTLEENIKGKEIKNSWRVRGMRFEKWERTQDYNEKRSSGNLNLISPATLVCLRARCGSLSFATLFN